MTWLAFTLLAAFIWTVVNIVDKHVIGHEFRDPVVAIVLKSYVAFIVFACASALSGADIAVGGRLILPSMLAGACVSACIYFYYSSLRKGDVSKVVPIFSTAPLFTLILGAVFLGERFPTLTYAGIGLIVLGAVTISAKHLRHHVTFDRAALFALGVAATSSVRSVLVKAPADEATIWPLLFWIGLGSAITATPMLIAHFGHIKIHSKKRFRAGFEHLVIVDLFDALGFLCLMIAIGLGPVSLVIAILHTKPLLIFVLATTLSVFKPKFLHDRLTPRILAKKMVGTLLVVGGALLVI
jgi:uncharacterized membrane protein